MYYRGVHRAQIRQLQKLLAEVLARDDREAARPRGDRAVLDLFAGDGPTRAAVEGLLNRCSAALAL